MLLAMQTAGRRMTENMPGNMMERKIEILNHGGGVMCWIHAGFSILFGVALLAIVVIAAVWLYRLMKKHTEAAGFLKRKAPENETALEVLNKRYAEGGIATEEYLERKNNLTA